MKKPIWFIWIAFAIFKAYGKAPDAMHLKSGTPIIQSSIDSINSITRKLYLSNPFKARGLAQKALLLAKQNNYKLGISQSFLNIGITYWSQSYYPISLFYINTALSYLSPKDSTWRAACYRTIGRNYVDLRNYPTALFYLNKAKAEAPADDMQEQEQVHSELAYAYLKSKQYSKALPEIDLALKLSRRLKNTGEIGILYGRLYSVYTGKKEYDKANAYCDSTYALSFTPPNKRLRTTVWIGRSGIAFNQKNYKAAIADALNGARLADSLGILELSTFANRWLYRSYEKLGDKDKALFYQSAFIKLQDSLNTIDKHNSAQLIQDYFALSSKLNNIEVIQEQNQLTNLKLHSQKLTIYNLAALIGILAISVYLLYRYSRQKNQLSKQIKLKHEEVVKQNNLIQAQATNLNELNNLKDNLLAIIGHDLRSPIATLRNMVELFNEGYISVDSVPELMQEMDPAIKAAELTLLNLLEWAGNLLKGVNIQISTIDLRKVVEETSHVFEYALAQKQLTYVNQVNTVTYVKADENYIKMILRNLISNAIKFTPAQGTIMITAVPHEHLVTLSVKDTGRGMSAEEVNRLFSSRSHFSNAGTQGEKGAGIGLMLCQQLVKLINAQLNVSAVPGQGSTFSVTLPVAQVASN